MSAARYGFPAVLIVVAICLIASTPVRSQSSSIFNDSKPPGNSPKSGAWLAKCQALPMNWPAGRRFGDGTEGQASRDATPADFTLPGATEIFCAESAPLPTSRALANNPCPENVVGAPGLPHIPGIPPIYDCGESRDTVSAELSSFGKAGAKIARAREEVLEILRSENTCSEWFATKDATPAATFRSLSFVLDKNGAHEILESAQPDSLILWRQPYVASATQDGGAHTAITINAHGAFYQSQGNVLKVSKEGGPLQSDGARLLTVGSYRGDTLPAQMVTLLHEFGHIIDLLPEDADNLDGKSVRNTDTVLRHCRAEVEARAEQAKQTAKR